MVSCYRFSLDASAYLERLYGGRVGYSRLEGLAGLSQLSTSPFLNFLSPLESPALITWK